jgi:TRAP-type mannitol/chloroaromatic compound transport system substrate-binding protein
MLNADTQPKKGDCIMAKRIFVFSMLVALFFTIAVPSPQAETVKWKLQTLWSAGEPPYKILEDFATKVNAATNGRLEITVFPAGGIVPTFEGIDALKNNILQVLNTWPGYFVGKEPAFAPLTDFLFAYEEPWEFDAFFQYRGGMDLLNELYAPYNGICIGVVLWGRESMFLKFPAYKMEDFKGHKIRSPQGMTADMLKLLGAGVVVLPGEEAYSALDKGVVDGADWSTPAVNHRMGFSRVAKYYIYPEYRSMPISDFTINKKEWEKLPADIKQILKSMVRELNYNQLAQLAIEDFKAMKEMEAMGCQPLNWKPEEIQRLRTFVRENVWTEWAKKSPMAKKVIDAQVAWLQEIKRIK